MASAIAQDDWKEAVDHLVDEVEQWAHGERWRTARESKEITERNFGTYAVPVLLIKTPQGEVHLDPIARYVAGADGRVDLYAWPSMNRMMIVRERGTGHWKIETDSGVEWPLVWSKDTVKDLIARLVKD